MTDAYELPTNYTIKALDLITHEGKVISLVAALSSIRFTEDIFSPFVHGNLVFEDSNDLHQLAPIIGEETIRFVYTTDASTDTIERTFRVYRIETSPNDATDRLLQVLHFCSIEAFLDSNITISKSYKNKGMRFIVEDALRFLGTNKPNYISALSGTYHLISPHWTPFQLINYTTSIARPKNDSTSMVLFYENANGFNYTNLEELMKKSSIGKWSAADMLKSQQDPTDEINPSNNIISYKIIKNSVDTLKSMQDGLYNNAVIAYDNITKSVKVFEYDYTKHYEKSSHLSDFKLNSENFEFINNNQRLTYIPTTSYRHDSPYFQSKMGSNNTSEKKEQVIPSRTSVLSQISAKQVEIEIAGNVKVIAGAVIDIDLGNTTALVERKARKHRYNAKKVLITKVTNIFSLKQHIQVLRVSDDSYTDELIALPEFDETAGNA